MRRNLGLLRLWTLLLVLGAAIGPTVGPVGAAGTTSAQHIEYGFNVFLIGNSGGASFNTRTMGKVNEARFGWVRFQLQWRELEPSPGVYNWAPYDTMVNAAASNGAKILISVAKSPDWANPAHPGALPTKDNTGAFGRTMQAAAARYKGKVQAWEVWNEPNLAGEVGGTVEVRPYFETLKAAYQGIKRGDSSATVVFAGLAPTTVTDRSLGLDDVQYLREFYSYSSGSGRNYFDVLGAHAGSAANEPERKLPGNPGSGECPAMYASYQGSCWNTTPDFYFRRVEDQRAVMEQNRDSNKQIWVTEFGWDSCQNLPAPSGYEYCLLNTEQEQADYFVRAFTLARNNWSWSGVLFVWNLNYATIPGISQGDEKYAWSLLQSDGSNRPAFDAIKAMPR